MDVFQIGLIYLELGGSYIGELLLSTYIIRRRNTINHVHPVQEDPLAKPQP